MSYASWFKLDTCKTVVNVTYLRSNEHVYITLATVLHE